MSACPRVAISFVDEKYHDMGVAFTRSHIWNIRCSWLSNILHVSLQKMIEMSNVWVKGFSKCSNRKSSLTHEDERPIKISPTVS